MFCGNCGKQIPDDSTFCPECGASTSNQGYDDVRKNLDIYDGYITDDNESDDSEAKPRHTMRVVGIVAILVIIVAIGGAAFFLFGRGGSGGGSGDYILGINDNGVFNYSEEIIAFKDDTSYKAKDSIYTVYSSYIDTRKLVAVLESDDNGDRTLYYLDNDKKAVKIDDEISNVKVPDYSDNTVVYTKIDDDYKYTVYTYNISKKEKKKLMDEVSSFVISPDGSMVLMNKEDDVYMAGESKEKEKISSKGGGSVFGVSNDGKHAYFSNDEGKLYYYNGKEEVKIDSDVYETSLFNKDATEMIYIADNKAYYYRAGEEASTRIASGTSYLSLIYANGAVSYRHAPVSTFAGRLMYSGSDIVRIDPKTYEGDKIVGNVDGYSLSSDGKSLIYLKKDKIYKVTNIGGKMTDDTIYDDKDVVRVMADFGLKTIYFIDDDGDLYYFDGKEATRLASDVTDAAFNNTDGNLYFVDDDETLYSIGKKADSKTKASSEDIINIYRSGSGVEVQNSDEEWAYIGKEMTKFYE